MRFSPKWNSQYFRSFKKTCIKEELETLVSPLQPAWLRYHWCLFPVSAGVICTLSVPAGGCLDCEWTPQCSSSSENHLCAQPSAHLVVIAVHADSMRLPQVYARPDLWAGRSCLLTGCCSGWREERPMFGLRTGDVGARQPARAVR